MKSRSVPSSTSADIRRLLALRCVPFLIQPVHLSVEESVNLSKLCLGRFLFLL